MFAQNVAEVRSIARALARRASRVTLAGAAAAASRATADLARFPATLAESLGKALVPGGWMHDAVSVATVGFSSIPCTYIWCFRFTLHVQTAAVEGLETASITFKVESARVETWWGVNDVG